MSNFMEIFIRIADFPYSEKLSYPQLSRPTVLIANHHRKTLKLTKSLPQLEISHHQTLVRAQSDSNRVNTAAASSIARTVHGL